MAEIKIAVSAENRTHDAFEAVERDGASLFATLETGILEVGSELAALEQALIVFDSRLGQERVLTIDTSSAASELQYLIDLQSRLGASWSQAAASGFSTDTFLSEEEDGFYSLDEGVLDSYASGTDYVPRTGIYQLHEGEKVIPASSVPSSSTSTSTYSLSFSPGSIVINGVERSARDLARELAPEIKAELERIDARK